MKPLAVALLILFSLSVVSSILTQSASALSAVSFTTKASATSVGQQFQRLYENGTNSVIGLDGSSTNGTYYKTTYNVAAGTASSSTTALSGSGNTVNADAFASPVDLSRYSLHLDGATQYATAADNTIYDITTESFWTGGLFKMTSLTGSDETILAKRSLSAGYIVSIVSDKLRFRMEDSVAPTLIIDSSAAISLNTWYAWAVSVDVGGNVAHLFLYDTSTATLDRQDKAVGGIGSITNTATFTVGRLTSSPVEYFSGVLDDIIPPQIAQNLSQIQFLAFAQSGTLPTGITDFYDFNEGITGATIKDIFGAKNMTPAGGPFYSADVTSVSQSRPTTYITGRDSGTTAIGFAKINLSDLSKVSDNYQTSSYHPKDIAQSTTKLYSPLYNASSQYGTLKLGSINRDFTSYSESNLFTGNSTVPVYAILADDTGTASITTVNLSSTGTKIETEKFTSTATMIGKTVDSIALKLSKNNSPTGTATIGTFDSSGNVVTTFATLDVSTLTTTPTLYYFGFSKPYTIQANDRIGIKYSGGDASNYVTITVTNSDVYDGTNAILSGYVASWTDDSTRDNLFQMRLGNIKTVVATDGSPDTTYTAFESGTNTIRIVKYTNTATLLGTALSHTAGQPFSLVTMSGSIIIQTATKTYSLNTSTDAIITLYNNAFNTRYPQPFTVSPSARTYNANPVYIANSTYAINYVPSTGTGTQTGVIISATTAPTLTAYAPSKYYYLTTNGLSVEGATAAATTWTIKTVGSQNQFHVTPYSEQIGTSLVENDTLFSQDVLHLNCDSGVYTVNVQYFATGDDSDCTLWRTTADSSATVGREIFNPYERTVDMVHAPVFTGYTFLINTGDPTAYYIKSLYDGKVVDVATFDSGSTATQRYLFGQCYDVEVINGNTNQTGLIGNICANDVTQKNINIDSITVPTNWQGTEWEYQISRSFTNATNNSVLFSVNNDDKPYDADIHVVNNLFENGTIDSWYNFTNQNSQITLNLNGYFSNNTLWFSVYNNDHLVTRAVSAGKSLDLANFMDSFGPVFGISIMGFFIVIVAGIFPRSMGTIAIIAVLATAGIMWSIGWLDEMPVALWPALIGLAAIGIFSSRRNG